MVAMAMATAIVRSAALRRAQVIWLSSVLLAAPVWAQYDSTESGNLGGAVQEGEGVAPVPDERRRPVLISAPRRALEIVPSLFVEETYTDNVRLSSSGSERSDWVTRLRPGISITGTGARARFAVNYRPELIYRLQEDSQDTHHYLNANGNAELVQRLLFIDARASVSQQNVSLQGPLTESNVNVTNNRTSVGTFLISPYLRREFGHDAQGELRLTYSTVNTGNTSAGVNSASLADSTSNRIDMSLKSGPAYKLLTWNAAYRKESIDYDAGQEIDIERISAGARRLLTPTLGITGNVGYEDNNYITTGPKVEGTFWNAGPEWTPTPRTRLVATAGERFHNRYYFLDFSHRTRLTTWKVNYRDEITTQRQQLLVPTAVDTVDLLDPLFVSAIPDAQRRQQVVQALVNQFGLPESLLLPVNFFTTVPFTQKRLLASFGIQGVRNTLLANVFWQTREALSMTSGPEAGDLALSQNTRQTGTSLTWGLRMTAQTRSNVSVGYTRNETPGIARQDDWTYIRLSLTRQFRPRMSGSLNFRRLHNDSNQSGAGYTENAISAALNMRF